MKLKSVTKMKTGGSVKKNTPATITTTPTGDMVKNSKKNAPAMITTSPKGDSIKSSAKNAGAVVNPTKPAKLKKGGATPKYEMGGWKTYSGYGKYPVTKSKK